MPPAVFFLLIMVVHTSSNDQPMIPPSLFQTQNCFFLSEKIILTFAFNSWSYPSVIGLLKRFESQNNVYICLIKPRLPPCAVYGTITISSDIETP